MGLEADRVAVVVCSRDRAGLLAEALPGICAQLRPGDEIVVVDSASRDDAVRRSSELAGVRCLRVDEPGLSRARNVGWRATAAEVVLFTDDDCRPLPGWRDAAAAALRDERVGAVWGTVLADRSSPVPLSVGLEDLAELTGSSDLSQAGHGACMAFRRAGLERIGGFDLWLGAGARWRAAEDKDAFDRARRAGFRVRAAPAMAVTHVVHRDDRAAQRVMHGYGIGTGALLRKRLAYGEPYWGALGAELWRHGVLPALRWTRERRGAAAVGALNKALGVVRGAWLTRSWPVEDGHLVPPA